MMIGHSNTKENWFRVTSLDIYIKKNVFTRGVAKVILLKSRGLPMRDHNERFLDQGLINL